MVKLVSKDNKAAVLEIDKGVKNKFRWAWLDKDVTLTIRIGKKEEVVTEKLGDYIGKCEIPGKAECLYCNNLISYGSRGYVAFTEHAKGQRHCKKVALRWSNYSLGSAFKPCDTFARGPQQHVEQPGQLMTISETTAKPLVPLSDRTVHCEALILGVLAEHSLPLSTAPVILETARELAKDPKALNHIRLDRTTTSYKMTFGLAKTFLLDTLKSLRTTPFSLNIDECTSNSDKRVLAILANYYCAEREAVVVEHLSSLEVIRVDSSSLFQELDIIFSTHDIPWQNCVCILMDSCSVMRGSKTGLETRIRQEKAPQLLDVDGDSCHHIHNAWKHFCAPFDNWVEYLQSDLHNDMKWSPDLRQFFEEVCLILGIEYTMPERFVTYRWLSCYDVCSNSIMMNDAFIIFYYSFLGKDDQSLYKEQALELLGDRNVSREGVNRIKEIWRQLSGKKLTEDGKKRKLRIAQKLIINKNKTLLITSFYLAILRVFKEYVSLFQSKEPLVHKLHDKQEQVFRDFLACFLKPEIINGKSAKSLKKLDLQSDDGKFVGLRDMFVGKRARETMKTCHEDDKTVTAFLNCASAAYVKCATHMQKKLPLENDLLRCMSAIDPEARGYSETANALDKLGTHLEAFLTEEEKESLPLEVRKYQVDTLLQPHMMGDRLDNWWKPLIKEGKYPAICKMAVVCLSCFHGPIVESFFNTKGDVIDNRSTRMRISNYSAMQTVRYGLKSRDTTTLKMFKKVDGKHDPVRGSLVANFRSAARENKEEKETQRKQRGEKLAAVRQRKEPLKSRAAEKRRQKAAAKVARLAHRRAQKLKSMHEKLEALAKERKLCQ